MKNYWFKKIGWLYIPTSWQGFVIVTVFIAFCLHIFLFIDSSSHSVSDIVYGIFPYIIPALLVYLWIGSEKSK